MARPRDRACRQVQCSPGRSLGNNVALATWMGPEPASGTMNCWLFSQGLGPRAQLSRTWLALGGSSPAQPQLPGQIQTSAFPLPFLSSQAVILSPGGFSQHVVFYTPGPLKPTPSCSVFPTQLQQDTPALVSQGSSLGPGGLASGTNSSLPFLPLPLPRPPVKSRLPWSCWEERLSPPSTPALLPSALFQQESDTDFSQNPNLMTCPSQSKLSLKAVLHLSYTISSPLSSLTSSSTPSL